MKKIFAPFLALLLMIAAATPVLAFAPREFYAIQVFYLQDNAQEQRVDQFLKDAYLPALHRMGLSKIGVFKPVGNDTSSNKRIYVLVPFKKMEQFVELNQKLQKDKQYLQAGESYQNTPHNQPNFKRTETILLQAFTGMPVSEKPALKAPVADRVYELRSYEGPTDKLYRNKVDMFNKGDEVGLFRRLGFNAVFYAEVLAGARMPNLMYMTSFESMQERDQHWKTFGADSAWKALTSNPEYSRQNVSKADIHLLRATSYSDL